MFDIDESVLPEGDVTVKVEWSTLNYKDGLAITGKSPVVRRFPMIPGIDFAGTVTASSNPAWQVGDQVMWDNTATSHRGRWFDFAERRELRRATTEEVVAPALPVSAA